VTNLIGGVSLGLLLIVGGLFCLYISENF